MKINIKENSNTNNTSLNHTSGYALLFAIVIISVISLLAIGLSNTSYKQLILSSVARDSQSSFFESDTATECALYADIVVNMYSSMPDEWPCGIDVNGNDTYFRIGGLSSGNPGFAATAEYRDITLPCFEFDVEKLTPANPGDPTTRVKSRGYNSCDKENPRTVEREIQVTY